MLTNGNYYFWFFVHVLVILAAYTSPFWLSVNYVLLGVVLYYLGRMTIGYCPVTKWQMGNTKHSFYYIYLNKLGLKVGEPAVKKITFLAPLIVLLFAVYWQS